MGVYIPDMEMPKDCIRCPLCQFSEGHWKCLADGSHADFGGTCRPQNCPLISVQPHDAAYAIRELPTADITEEQVAEYCRKRNLVCITAESFEVLKAYYDRRNK